MICGRTEIEVTDDNILYTWLEHYDKENKLTPKQTKIIESAIELFAEKGYASTSTSEIAKKAGVAEGTIFRHYKTKKDLLLSIVTPMMIKFAFPFLMTQFSDQIFKNKPESYEQFVRTVMQNRYEFVKGNETLLKIFLQELAFQPELKQSFFQMASEKIYPKIKALIEHFKQEGELVDEPAESIFRLTVTNIFGFLFARFIALPELDWDDETEMERTIRFIVSGVSAR